MTLIGLTGVARSGKDTAGEWLTTNLHFERRAFADGVKAAVFRLNPIIKTGITRGVNSPFSRRKHATPPTRLRDHVWQVGKELAKEHPEVRRLYQVMGTEVGREMFGQDVWVNQLLNDYQPDQHHWVITDVRFPNEAAAIQDRGGVVIRISRPGVHAINDHISEHAMDDYPVDAELVNDGTAAELGERLHALLNKNGWM